LHCGGERVTGQAAHTDACFTKQCNFGPGGRKPNHSSGVTWLDITKVGRSPAALNFAADTGWDTDWLWLVRAWARKWQTLSSENGNYKLSFNHNAVVAVDFCV